MLKNNFTLFANFLSVRQIGLGVLVALGVITLSSCGGGDSSSSSFIYVVNDNSNTISMYSVLSSGQLQALSTSTVQTGSQPYGIATWRLQ